ncbi:hypothetical protein HPO96_35925 [Kribbella sandramycini]|uniref:Immunity protein Imm1 n=1 Tax=Kribbella sandramycini TaxID=60450 RepID=A0A7Y4L746_9ACTN|nr:Imm1 family immunity protein [Kribbella sandramycini]MBB6568877.1 hypothetical protein [Kribbella sandramycini]NOL45645.1 hypothetical protein [Kribbella sandramycini]
MNTIRAYYKHEHDTQPLILETAADIDLLIDGLLSEDYDHSVAALYVEGRLNAAGVPDHELLVAVNNEDGDVGALRYMGDGGTYYTHGPGNAEVTYFYTGSDREFPADSEVSLTDVREAIKEFLATGTRPAGLEWTKAA